MPSLLLVVFVLQLFIHLANTVGAAAINNLLWALYNKLPASTSADYNRLGELRREVVRLKQELNATSAQDQFAKWAKLQRQYDKAVAEYDKKAQSLQSFRSSFDQTASVLRWLGTNGLRFFLQFWYQKQPMFWLEKGWMPWYVEWLLSFPRAPIGSISIQVWATACASVIKLLSEALVSVYGLVLRRRSASTSKSEKVSMKMGAGGGVQMEHESKKDL